MSKNMCQSSPCSPIYFFGVIGAAIYYIGNAATFWMGVLGFLKALVWPVFLVQMALQFLSTQL